jgi:hypothetical protein
MSALEQLPPEYRVNIEAIALEPDREFMAKMVGEMLREIDEIKINSDWIRFRCLIGMGVGIDNLCLFLRSNNSEKIQIALSCVGLTPDHLVDMFEEMPVFVIDGREGIWVNRELPSN